MADVAAPELDAKAAETAAAVQESSKAAPQAEAAEQKDTGTAPEQQDTPQVTFKVQYGKSSAELKRPASSTVADLKAEVEKALAIPPSKQKLMYKGLLKDDAATLQKVGIKNGAKVLLIGSSEADIAAAKASAASSSGGAGGMAWDAPKQDEDITKQPQHAKVIAKGVPEEAMPGIAERQVPLPDSLLNFNGLYNSQGSKVRLTFKPESQQLWIASTTTTQKLPYGSIAKIESWPIAEHPGYSVVSLGLGAGSSSRYWLYFFPSQYVSGIKIRLIGLRALI